MSAQLAVCAEMVFLDLPLIERVMKLDDAGFEIELWDIRDKDLSALAATGARFGSMTGYSEGSLCDADSAHHVVRTAGELIPAAKELGIKRLVVHPAQLIDGQAATPRFRATGDMWLTAAKTLEELGRLGEEHDVIFMLENLNTILDHPGIPLGRAKDTLSLVKAVDHPNVKMMLDLYHAQIGEGNLIELVRAASPYIGEIQVADVPGRCEPGTGEINYRTVAAALSQLGYSGPVGMEAYASADSEAAIAAFAQAFEPLLQPAS